VDENKRNTDSIPPDFGQSYVAIGWKVNSSQDPSYWIESENPRPGFQPPDALVRIPAHLVAAHTAIIAQSGSGKSFFLGRLIEEILLQTSARCLVFDPNADFRRIHESDAPGLWTDARYDYKKKRGKLPHESSQLEFASRWDLISKRIRLGSAPNAQESRPTPGNSKGDKPQRLRERLQIWWPSLDMALMAEELNPMLQTDLYYCHQVVKAFARVFDFKYSAHPELKDLLVEVEGIFDVARALCKHDDKFRQTLEREFGASQIMKELNSRNFPQPREGFAYIDPSVEVPESVIKSATNTFIELALKIVDEVSPEVERFYFGKARMFQRAGILETTVQNRAWIGSPTKRLEVIDLPSLDQSTKLLAVDSILTSEWELAQDNWERALAQDSRKDTRSPTFIVVDEAHNLIPKDPKNRAENAVREQFRKIIAEGRKYGLFLILVSQRPDKLDSMILSECDNKAVMKLGSAATLELTSEILGLDDLPPKLLQKCLEFATGRVLLAGSWRPEGPEIAYAAARRTQEGGRNLSEAHWSSPLWITALKLAPPAKAIAMELQTKYPGVKFRRGRWTVAEKAQEMTLNLLETYRKAAADESENLNRERLIMTLANPNSFGTNSRSDVVRLGLVAWLDGDGNQITQQELQLQLERLIARLTEAELNDLSMHLTGSAFDIEPLFAEPTTLKQVLEKMPYACHVEIEPEGKDQLWHIQCTSNSIGH